MSSKESFLKQINFLKNFRRVIAIDLTGFGKSKKMERAYSLDDYVFDVLSVINELKIESYDLLAHSFGGRIAVKLALLDERVKKIVLTGSAGLKPKRKLSYYFKVYYYKLCKNVFKSKRLNNFGSPEYKMLSGVERQSYVKIVNTFLDGLIPKIKNKTLLIFGKNDGETPLYMAKRFNKKIKNSYLYVINDAGHFCFIEKSHEFNVMLSEFLNGE